MKRSRSISGSARGWAAFRKKKMLEESRKPSTSKGYHKRRESLDFLGYRGYKTYLQSKEWQIIRDEYLKRYSVCVLCESPATQVHHIRYDVATLIGTTFWNLVQLCRKCHEKIEFDGKKKRHFREVNKILFELARETERGKRWINWKDHQENQHKAQKRKKNIEKHKRRGS